MAQLRLRKNEFLQAGAGLVLVGMGSVTETSQFVRRHHLPFPMIADPEGSLYAAYGLHQASFTSLFSPQLLFKAVSLLGQGYGVGRPVGDIRQLPGVFIIDTRGTIVFRHVGTDPADHPDTETILQKLRKIT